MSFNRLQLRQSFKIPVYSPEIRMHFSTFLSRVTTGRSVSILPALYFYFLLEKLITALICENNNQISLRTLIKAKPTRSVRPQAFELHANHFYLYRRDKLTERFYLFATFLSYQRMKLTNCKTKIDRSYISMFVTPCSLSIATVSNRFSVF